MAVLLHDRPEAAGQKQREALRLPRTSAVVALFAFSSRMDRDSMRLFARTHGDEVRAAAIASTGQEVLVTSASSNATSFCVICSFCLI